MKNKNSPIVLALLAPFCFLGASSSAFSSVYINQVGYQIGEDKRVYSDFPSESFEILCKTKNEVLSTGQMSLRVVKDPATGLDLYEGDFSGFEDEGEFVIRVGDKSGFNTVSRGFEIQRNPYENLTVDAFRTLYFQRCGMDLDGACAGQFHHKACHTVPVEYHSTAGGEGRVDVSGGWHDAGDYGKYIAPGAVTVGTLFLAQELAFDYWSRDDLNLPESGNGVPDLLDEARYELEWMFKMQREDGAVHEKIHTNDYVGFILPDRAIHAPQHIYEVTSTATADFAAIMAWASVVWKDQNIDLSFSKKCLDAAKRAYAYLSAHPGIFPAGGFVNPEDTLAGGYSDAEDKDERFWAAIELYLATSDDVYVNDIQAFLAESKDWVGETGWKNPSALAAMSYLLRSEKGNATDAIWKELHDRLLSQCERETIIASKDGFRVVLDLDDYVWGTNGIVLSRAMNHLVAAKLTGDPRFEAIAREQLNHILGANCTRFSYVTGHGEKTPMNIHHAVVVADGIYEPIPGYLAGGPDPKLNDAVLREVFDANTPPAQAYVDHVESYASNEITIYWNAFLALVSGYFSQ